MTIRKFAVAGLVLAAVGLTVTVATVVIGQQPATAEKKDGADEKTVPASGTTRSAADEFGGAAPPAAVDSRLPGTDEGPAAAPARAGAGGGVAAPPAGAGAGGGVEVPPAGSGSAAGAAPGKATGPSKSSAKTRSGNVRSGGGMMMQGMQGMQGMGGMPGMMPGGGGGMSGGMMPGMMGSGMMSAPVPEDEHLETWVSRALADYAQTEDQNARKQQRDEIAKALDQIFDIRQERRMEELETLEQRVQKLRGTLETREKLKADILKNRLDYLIREVDGLGWGDGLPAPGRSAPTGIGPPGGGGTGSSSGGSSSFKRGAGGGFGAGEGSRPASGGPVFGAPFNSGGAGSGAGPGSSPAPGGGPGANSTK